MTETRKRKGFLQMHSPSADGGRIVERPDPPEHARRPIVVLFLMLLSVSSGTALALWMQRPTADSYVGYLQAAGRTVTAGRNARIAQILVSEAQEVKAGDPLVVLTDTQFNNDRLAAVRNIEQLEAELSQAQARAVVDLQWRLKDLERDMFLTQLKSASYLQKKLSQEVEHIARKNLTSHFQESDSEAQTIGKILQIRRNDPPIPTNQERIETLLKIHESKNAMEVAAAQVELCDQRLAELHKLKTELPDKVRLSMGIHVVEARLAEAREKLTRLEASQTELTLRAEVPGTIGVLQQQVGDLITSDETIVDILDEEQRYLLAHVPSTDLDKFALDAEVDLEFPNHTHREGRVVKTSSQAFPTNADDSATCVTKVAVRIEPSGKLWPTVPYRTTVKVRPR